jgi:hypothetical protein
MRTVLNPQSRELWRERGKEREFHAPATPTVRRFTAKARRYWAFEQVEKTSRRMLVAAGPAEREELGSNPLHMSAQKYSNL